MDKRQKIVYLCGLGVFLLFCLLVGYYVGVPMVRFAEEPEMFRAWVDKYGIWGRLVFVGMVVLQVIVAFIPGEAVELAAGYAFGAMEGTVLSMAGIVIGSWVIFILVRKFGIRLVQVFFSARDIVQVGFLKSTRKIRVLSFLLMLIPGTPKDFLSYFAGLTKLSLKQWLLIVSVARLPSVLTSTLTGAAAGQKQYTLAGILFGFTLLISLLGVLYYRKICKEENELGGRDKAA